MKTVKKNRRKASNLNCAQIHGNHRGQHDTERLYLKALADLRHHPTTNNQQPVENGKTSTDQQHRPQLS